MSLRVLLVDDQRLVRAGFREILTGEGFTVVGEAADGREAVELAERVRADVVLMDIQIPASTGSRPRGGSSRGRSPARACSC